MRAIVIVAEGLHLGYVGCYGNDWLETPHLDRLAAEGIVFDQHYADRPDAEGASHAWRTGAYCLPLPDRMDVPAARPAVNLFQQCRRGGVHTSLVIDERSQLPGSFREGWHEIAAIPAADRDETSLECSLEAVRHALDRLAAADNWLLWVELATLLPPWEVPEEFQEPYFQSVTDEDDPEADADEQEPLTPLPNPGAGLLEPTDLLTPQRLQNTYAAAVSYLDAGIGQMLEDLATKGLAQKVLLLVTTDRGVPLGEHGLVGTCRPWLHDELIHLPLIVRLPGGDEAGRRVSALTQSLDLTPTLLDAFGLAPPPVHGHNLLPLARGKSASEQVRPYAVAGLQTGEDLEWALRSPEWSLLLPLRVTPGVRTRATQLYVKPDDRWEVNNVVQHHLEFVEQLEQTLRRFVELTRLPGPITPPPLPESGRNPEAKTEP